MKLYEELEREEFDFLIVGTGLEESLLAAAFSRVGAKVLHLDELQAWIKDHLDSKQETTAGTASGNDYLDRYLQLVAENHSVDQTTETWHPACHGLDINRRPLPLVGSGAKDTTEDSSVITPVLFGYSHRLGVSSITSPTKGQSGSSSSLTREEIESVPLGRSQKEYSELDEPRRQPSQSDEAEIEETISPSDSNLGEELGEERRTRDEDFQELRRRSRSFNIDLSPRLCLCGGEMVERLIESGIGRYLEFMILEKLYVCTELPSGGDGSDGIWKVPCSKGDVFKSKLLSMGEKRMLMKFLQFCADYTELLAGEDIETRNERQLAAARALTRPQNKKGLDFDVEGFEHKPFSLFLEHCSLSKKLQDIILYTVALLTANQKQASQVSTLSGLRLLRLYLSSMGRFGDSGLMISSFGFSELPQAFCRYSATFGGIYVLQRRVEKLLVHIGISKAVACVTDQGDVFRAKHFVLNGTYKHSFLSSPSPPPSQDSKQRRVLRRISIIRRSISAEGGRVLLVVPPQTVGLDNPHPVQVLQLDSSVSVCPEGMYVLYLSTLSQADESEVQRGEEILRLLTERLLSSTSSTVESGEETQELWHVTFSAEVHSAGETLSLPHNVFLSCGNASDDPAVIRSSTAAKPEESASRQPFSVHCEEAMSLAKELFHAFYPQEEFLSKSFSASQAEAEEADEEGKLVMEVASLVSAARTEADE